MHFQSTGPSVFQSLVQTVAQSVVQTIGSSVVQSRSVRQSVHRASIEAENRAFRARGRILGFSGRLEKVGQNFFKVGMIHFSTF